MKHFQVILLGAIIGAFDLVEIYACTGCVELDEYTFDKLLSKFEATIVKFDVAFPYGDKHEAFAVLAKDAKSEDNLMVAQVGVKDYGEKDNEALAKRYGMTKKDFPSVKLFIKDRKDPITFSDKVSFTTDNLRKFIKDRAGIHLSMPGCIQKLDQIAFRFMDADQEKKKDLLKKAEETIAGLGKEHSATANVYKLMMQKIIEKGDTFIDSEKLRVTKLLDEKISEEKKKTLNTKLNVLQSFIVTTKNEEKKKEDL